ncbi:MAG: hypothetical protein E7295_10570 [Lachnospiraceae bacterium]|nr:hypothetical protein [Lachnospiraceae bacterium]
MSKELTEKQRTVIGIFLLTVLGAFALILLVYKRKFHPAVLFFVSVIGSGVIEYATGWVLYNLMGGVRLWDYNVEIWNWGNIDGYVCARSVLIFGVFGMVYGAWIIPRLMEWIKKVKARPSVIFSAILAVLVFADIIFGYIIMPIKNGGL